MENSYYCVIKDNSLIALGQLPDIVLKVFNYRLDNNLQLIVKVGHFPEVTYHSYNRNEWTLPEIHRDVDKFLLGKLKDFGFTIFKQL